MAALRLLVLEPHSSSDPVGRLGTWLRDAGLELDVRDLEAGDPLPDSLSQHAGLLVLGGPMGAADDAVAPYLPAVRALLREAVGAQVPTLAICLGHQLLALANGGRVERNPEGPEIGPQLVAKRAVASTDPLFGSLPITPDVIQWHEDAVTTLPAGAVQLASSPGCAQQAFRLGRLAWGIQFHIETTPGTVRLWAANSADDYDADVLERAIARADAIDADLVDAWQPFAAAFADVVRDPAAVRTGRGVPVSTAEPITDPAAIRAALAAEVSASRGPVPVAMPSLPPRPDQG